MADNEVSKITWIAIVVALAGGIYGVSKTQVPAVIGTVFDKIGKIVGADKVDRPELPNPNDAKWVEKGNYGANGYFVRDNDGHGIVYALDPQQPVIVPERAISFTQNNQSLTSLRFLDKTILPKDSSGYFADNINLTIFDTKNLDTSNVTDMTAMFDNMHALKTLDVSNFNTSNVTNMRSMFAGMSALTALDVSKFNTSNVTNMSGLFYGMSALTTLDVSKFDTSNVTYVAYMFGDMNKLTPPDTSKFDTSKMTDKDAMFASLPTLPIEELQ